MSYSALERTHDWYIVNIHQEEEGGNHKDHSLWAETTEAGDRNIKIRLEG